MTCAPCIPWAASLREADAHRGELVITVVAGPPTLGGGHPLNIVSLALWPPPLHDKVACVALEC